MQTCCTSEKHEHKAKG